MAIHAEDDGARKLIDQLAGTPNTLTTEEREECSAYLASLGLTGNEGGYWAISEDVADDFRRKLISDYLQGRAHRFYLLEKDAELACSSAARACAFYPTLENHYELATMLKRTGREGDAKTIFRYFLQLAEIGPRSQFEEMSLRYWDLPAAISVARGEVKEPQ